MKRNWVVGVIALCGALLEGCKKELPPNVGSGVQKSELRTLPEFRKIRAAGIAHVEVTIGPPCQAELTTDENLLALVTTSLKDGMLVVGTVDNLRPKVPVRVRLCAAALDAMSADGASQLSVSKLAAQQLSLRGAGAAKLRVSGSAATVELELRTASQADLSELSSATTVAKIDHAASARIGHVETLNVTITGPGSASYRGQPTIVRNVNKLGRLIREQ
jgi:hypothetical protein